MTRLQAANVFVFQWFFVRLAKWGRAGRRPNAWALIVGVLPLSGWRGSYVGPAWFVALTKPRDSG